MRQRPLPSSASSSRRARAGRARRTSTPSDGDARAALAASSTLCARADWGSPSLYPCLGSMARARLAPLLLLATACSDTTPEHAASPWPERTWEAGAPIECPSDEGALSELTRRLGAPPPAIAEAGFEAFGGRIASDPARLGYLHDVQSSPRTLACFAGTLVTRADVSVSSDHPRTSLI